MEKALTHDYRELVIDAFAESEAALLDRAAALETVVILITRAAVEQIHELTVECDRIRGRHDRLLDQYRHLRERLMSEQQVV